MEAFYQNIDALEKKTETLIQKWKEVCRENQVLAERNRKLEEDLKLKDSRIDQNGSLANAPLQPIIKKDFSTMESMIDTYIAKIDACIDLINKEMNGQK